MHYFLGMLPLGPGTVETLTRFQINVRVGLDGAIVGSMLGAVAFAIRAIF